jgi:uncharacterized small protein (DUF1192 family)
MSERDALQAEVERLKVGKGGALQAEVERLKVGKGGARGRSVEATSA